MDSLSERIYIARRMALLERLGDVGMLPEAAEKGVADYEAVAASEGRSRGSGDYWHEAEAWVLERRQTRRY